MVQQITQEQFDMIGVQQPGMPPLRSGTMPILNSTQVTLIVAPIFMYALATAAVVLRLSARRVKKQELGVDDMLCILGLIIAYGQLATVFVLLYNGGLGLPLVELSRSTIWIWFRATAANYIIYIVNVAVLQLSILFFYTRMFGIKKSFRITCYVFAGLVGAWAIAGIFTRTLTCGTHTEAAIYYVMPTEHGECADKNSICRSIAITHVIFDLTVLALPLPLIWKLKTTAFNKVVITSVFAAGLFATACAILRMHCLIALGIGGPTDLTLVNAPSILYQSLETPIGLVCICVPTFAPLWTKLTNSRIASYAKRMLSRSDSSTVGSSQRTGNKEFGQYHGLAKTASMTGSQSDNASDELPLQGGVNEKIRVTREWNVERHHA